MTIQITIIGLGRIGASVGLALAKHTDQLTRLGHDIEPSLSPKSKKLGVVDKTDYNLPAAVEKAGIILLALPFDQIYETLKIIAPVIREDAVVMDTAPCKSAVANWMKELLPLRCHYIGLAPVINPQFLDDNSRGIGAARADLFMKGLMAIAAPPGTDGAALKLAADFSSLLGASPFFIDIAELDGFLAAVQILPQLAAAALTEAIVNPPGWADRRKLTGAPFAAATALVDTQATAALAEAALSSREHSVRALDGMIAALRAVRDEIDGQQKEALNARLERAHDNRAQWLQERSQGDWRVVEFGKTDLPKSSAMLKQILVGVRKDKKRK